MSCEAEHMALCVHSLACIQSLLAHLHHARASALAPSAAAPRRVIEGLPVLVTSYSKAIQQTSTRKRHKCFRTDRSSILVVTCLEESSDGRLAQ